MVGLRTLSTATLVASLTLGCTLDRDGRAQIEGTGGQPQGGAGPGGNIGGFGAQGGSGGGLDLAPGPVENLAATVANGTVTLTWDNPTDSDLANVMVVHRAGEVVTFDPVHGTVYSVGAEVVPTENVIFSDLAETTMFTPAIPGVEHNFSVWAIDATGQYSARRRTVGLDNALGDQMGQIQVALDGTVTVTTQPPDFSLDGTATYNNGQNELDVTLNVTNATGRVVFNLKGLVTNEVGGNALGPRLPRTTGTPYVAWGPAGLELVASQTANITIANVDGLTDPVTFDISLVDAPYLIGTQRIVGGTRQEHRGLVLIDSAFGSNQDIIAPTPFASYAVNYRRIVVSPDGRRAYVGAKASPFVTAIDLVTLTNVIGADLTGAGRGNVSGLATSPDGARLFAALSTGVHHWGKTPESGGSDPTMTSVDFVEIDPATLDEITRVPILTNDTALRFSRTMAINHAGTMAAMVVRHPLNSAIDAEIFFVDLATMMPIDTNPLTAEIDPVVIASDIRPDQVIFSADDARLFVGMRSPGAVEIIDLASWSTTTLSPAAPMQRAVSLHLASDRLLVGGDDINTTSSGTPLTSFLLANDAEVVLDSGLNDAHKIVPHGDRYYVFGSAEVAVFDAATHQRIDMDGALGMNNIGLRTNLEIGKHFGAITPF